MKKSTDDNLSLMTSDKQSWPAACPVLHLNKDLIKLPHIESEMEGGITKRHEDMVSKTRPKELP